MKRWAKRLLKAIVACTVLLICGGTMLLAAAQIESTPHGVHERLLIPLPGSNAIALPIYSGTGHAVRIPGFLDGPIVARSAGGRWTARWFCEDRAHRVTGSGDLLELRCAGKDYAFSLADVPIPVSVGPMPTKLVVISDVEGNQRFLDDALTRLEITDSQGRWQYGDGHLVMLGDSVDRGRDVFAVLWRLHALSRQAQAAGGAVHVVLGNHEQYVLRGNFSRAHPEHRYAMMETGGYAGALAPGTVIGDWLRAQPVALKLGSTVFVHGGISPRVAGVEMTITALNAANRQYWREGAGRIDPTVLDSIFGNDGLTQYRGYVMSVPDAYPLATRAQVEAALGAFAAERVVVAHTLVDRVENLHDGRVYAVDVNSATARPEVLLLEDGRPRVIDLSLPRGINAGASPVLRRIRLSDPADRVMLGRMYREVRRMAALPHPY